MTPIQSWDVTQSGLCQEPLKLQSFGHLLSIVFYKNNFLIYLKIKTHLNCAKDDGSDGWISWFSDELNKIKTIFFIGNLNK